MMNADMQALLQTVLMAVLPVLAAALVNWALKAARTETGKWNQQTLTTLFWLAGMAVRAAEQAEIAGYITDKKKFAIEYVETWFSTHGIPIDVDTLSAAIEAAVMEEFGKAKLEQQAKELPAAPVMEHK